MLLSILCLSFGALTFLYYYYWDHKVPQKVKESEPRPRKSVSFANHSNGTVKTTAYYYDTDESIRKESVTPPSLKPPKTSHQQRQQISYNRTPTRTIRSIEHSPSRHEIRTLSAQWRAQKRPLLLPPTDESNNNNNNRRRSRPRLVGTVTSINRRHKRMERPDIILQSLNKKPKVNETTEKTLLETKKSETIVFGGSKAENTSTTPEDASAKPPFVFGASSNESTSTPVATKPSVTFGAPTDNNTTSATTTTSETTNKTQFVFGASENEPADASATNASAPPAAPKEPNTAVTTTTTQPPFVFGANSAPAPAVAQEANASSNKPAFVFGATAETTSTSAGLSAQATTVSTTAPDPKPTDSSFSFQGNAAPTNATESVPSSFQNTATLDNPSTQGLPGSTVSTTAAGPVSFGNTNATGGFSAPATSAAPANSFASSTFGSLSNTAAAPAPANGFGGNTTSTVTPSFGATSSAPSGFGDFAGVSSGNPVQGSTSTGFSASSGGFGGFSSGKSTGSRSTLRQRNRRGGRR